MGAGVEALDECEMLGLSNGVSGSGGGWGEGELELSFRWHERGESEDSTLWREIRVC